LEGKNRNKCRMLDKTFNPQAIEDKHYTRWEASGAFACDPASKAKPFTVMMPPPNVTGSLHMGHALNMTLQDVLTRYYRMKGRDALWQPGTDHAGIATQMVVERLLDKEGINRRKMGRDKFLERVWAWKAESGGTIVTQLRKLGATPDWKRERFTMDEGLSEAVLKAFVQLYREKLIYRDKRLVNWDPKLHTAISDLEVEQKEKKGHMWHIRYPVEGATEEFITVATTRPETMLGDTAVAVHPDDERYKHLVGKFVSLPLTGRLIPIIADEYSDPEKGSGAVKITPAHDFNDFEVGKRHNLPMINIFDINAHLNENAPEGYVGLERFAARKKILTELEAMELLAQVEDIKHAVPIGDRSGEVIEPYLTDQWYCDAATLAKPAIKAVQDGKTKFVPKSWENTYFEWMKNIQPWCISRQLWWGHQIPAWYGPDGTVFVDEDEKGAQAQADKHYGEKVKIKRDEDVLDTWFSSALWPFSTLGWPDENAMKQMGKYYPGDVLVTGFRYYFLLGRAHDDVRHPFHGRGAVQGRLHARARPRFQGPENVQIQGQRHGPLELTEKFGADALRFTMIAMAAQGRDIRLSEDRVEGYRNFATKLWNATRYCEMNGCLPVNGFKPESVTYAPNKWIIHSLAEATESMSAAIENYKFNEAAAAIYQFVWNTFCDWYLEFTKPVLAGGDEKVKKEIQQTTGWILDQILTLLNPLMPFITEELYASIATRGKDEMLLTAKWPEYSAQLKSAEAEKEIGWLVRCISEIRSVRADMNVPPKAMIKLLVKDASAGTKKNFAAYDEILKRMARIETIEFSSNVPKGSIQTILDEATLVLPIADIIDLTKERERLRKEIARLEGEIGKVDQKLGNEQFVSNAPEEIILEHKQRKHDAESARNKFSQALKQLESA
jgi:valyl-tRNA synthetase